MADGLTNDTMYSLITAQRLRLADTLDGRAMADWDVDSLCSGWKVRHVVGHLVSILEIPLTTFLGGVVKARNFDTYADKTAREIGARDPSRLGADFRSLATKRFAPPIVGPIAPLTDVLIHTRDIERPLGIAPTLDPVAVRTALNYTCGGKAYGFVSPKRTKGLRFEATDVEWSIGAGPVVLGTSEALLLASTGRRSAVADLSGDGATTFAARL